MLEFAGVPGRGGGGGLDLCVFCGCIRTLLLVR